MSVFTKFNLRISDMFGVRLLTLDPSDSFHSLDRPGLYQENPVHGLCPHHQNGDTEPEQEFQSLTILTFLQVRAN